MTIRPLFILLTALLLASPALAGQPSVSVAFSPRGGATEAIVGVIGEARHSIHLAAYRFSSRPIAAALLAAHRRGVEVKAVLDGGNKEAAREGDAALLANGGIPTRIDSRYAAMHDKFLVIDAATVETGSFNFTGAAEWRNAEDVLILREYPNVAARYEARWRQLWAESRDVPASESP